ncbi:MAG: cupin domain-containing protein [Desulfatirhabdiaceae bacterium]
MGFQKSVNQMNLQEFRPGIRSMAEFGDKLVMACMEIGPGKEDAGHQHPVDQCGIVIDGKIEMFIGDTRRMLEAMDTYFIPAGVKHGWKTFDVPARILDVSAK